MARKSHAKRSQHKHEPDTSRSSKRSRSARRDHPQSADILELNTRYLETAYTPQRIKTPLEAKIRCGIYTKTPLEVKIPRVHCIKTQLEVKIPRVHCIKTQLEIKIPRVHYTKTQLEPKIP